MQMEDGFCLRRFNNCSTLHCGGRLAISGSFGATVYGRLTKKRYN